MKIDLRFLTVLALMTGLRAVAADLTGTIFLNGTPPPEETNTAMFDDQFKDTCGKGHTEPVLTQFYVVGPNKGLKDVVVYLANIKGKSTGATAAPVILDQKGCEYLPYIFAVQTGQKIIIRNSDPISHNIHVVPIEDAGNDEQNRPQAAGDPEFSLAFSVPEDFIKFKCDTHVWMFAYATVVDHPWYAVSGSDGKFKIANVPPGKYTVKAMHRKANDGKGITKEIEVTDAGATLDFTLEALAAK